MLNELFPADCSTFAAWQPETNKRQQKLAENRRIRRRWVSADDWSPGLESTSDPRYSDEDKYAEQDREDNGGSGWKP